MASEPGDSAQALRRMQQEMNRLFELSLSRAEQEPAGQGHWQPPADIYEDAEQVVIKLDLPEVAQQDVAVQIEEQTLVISGERRLAELEDGHYLRMERSHGPFERRFALPPTVDAQQVAADLDQGVLSVVLPKRPAGQPRQIEIEVKEPPGG